MKMLRTAFAMVAATLIFAALSGTSQAAPIAPLSGVTASDSGQLTKVYWHRHRHCWRGPYGHLHCGW
jgi:ABC-type glycerol-3-phosphate transport system substrate-binding protein